jgi:hypothetical protein
LKDRYRAVTGNVTSPLDALQQPGSTFRFPQRVPDMTTFVDAG